MRVLRPRGAGSSSQDHQAHSRAAQLQPGDIRNCPDNVRWAYESRAADPRRSPRSEEHTSELQSLTNLVCRLLLEKKKNNKNTKHETEKPCYNKKCHT